MKTIIAINGSARVKSNTGALLQKTTEVLASVGYSVEIIQLARMNLIPCRGCAACVEKGHRCKTRDDMEKILEKIRQADGLILASPIYMWQISTTLKMFFDRLVSYFHRPDPSLTGKPVFVMTTSAGPFVFRNGVKYMQEIAHHLGMRPKGSLSQLGGRPLPVMLRSFQPFLKLIESDRAKHRPSYKELFNFWIQQGSAMTFLPEDRKYFIKLGWDKALYYYPCRIGFLKRGVMKLMSALAGKMMAKAIVAED